MKTRGRIGKSSADLALDDSTLREMAPKIEAQLEKSKPAFGEIVKLWALIKLFQLEAERIYSHRENLIDDGTRGRGRPPKPTDLKTLFEKYLPQVDLKTAYRLFTCGGFVAEKFGIDFVPLTLQRKIELPLLATETPAKLARIDRRVPKKQEELFLFADGGSQKSWLDQFANAKRGGNQYERGGERRKSAAQKEREQASAYCGYWNGMGAGIPLAIAMRTFRYLNDAELETAIDQFSNAADALRAWKKTPKSEREAEARAALAKAAKQSG